MAAASDAPSDMPAGSEAELSLFRRLNHVYVPLRSWSTAKCLDLPSWNTPYFEKCHYRVNQLWYLDGELLRVQSDSRCMDFVGSSARLEPCDASRPTQLWYRDGSFLRTRDRDLCLTMLSNGDISLSECTCDMNQYFEYGSETLSPCTTTSITTSATTTSATSTSTLSSTTVTTSFTSTSTSSLSTTTSSSTSTSTSSSTTSSATTSTSTSSSSSTSSATTSTTTSSLTATTFSTTSTTTSSSSSTSSATTSTTTSSLTATTFSTTSTTTSSSTSTSTVSTTTVTTVSSTTGTTLVPPPQAQVFFNAAEAREVAILAELIKGNGNSTTITVAGATVMAVKLDVAAVEQAGGSLAVPVEGTEVEVVVPASVFRNLGVDSVAMTITAFDPSSLVSMSSGTSDNRDSSGGSLAVRAATSIGLRSLSSSRTLDVNGLAEPIQITLQANRSDDISCAFWDEERQDWSTHGITTVSDAEGRLLVCKTTHLSFFGGIARGFASTFECSQFALLNAEAISQLVEGTWFYSSGAIMLWSVLVGLVGTLVLALLSDVRAGQECVRWRDEYFLIPCDTEGELVAEEEKDNRDEEEVTQSSRHGLACIACLAVTACCTLISWCRSSSALRDALDDVLSNWCNHFSEVRDFFEGCCGELIGDCQGTGTEGGRVFVLIHRIMDSTILSYAQRRAGLSLHVSSEVIDFVLNDEDLLDVLHAHQERRHSKPALSASAKTDGGHAAETDSEDAMAKTCTIRSGLGILASPVGALGREASCGNVAAETSEAPREKALREEAWAKLHEDVRECLGSGSTHSELFFTRLPRAIWHLFLVQTPFGAALVTSMFMPSAMRALLFMVEIVGALLLGTLLFSASGPVRVKRARAECEDLGVGIEFQIGRLFAVGIFSLLFAGIPSAFLGSLHGRSFKKLPYEGCREWERQLRSWRIQDRLVWTIGSLYLAACVFFMCVFLANVSEEDSKLWCVSAAISIVEDTIVIPLAVAIFIPCMAVLTLSIVSWAKNAQRDELIHRRLEPVLQNCLPARVSI